MNQGWLILIGVISSISANHCAKIAATPSLVPVKVVKASSSLELLEYLHWVDDQTVVYGSTSKMNGLDLRTNKVVWKRIFDEPISSATFNGKLITIVGDFRGVEQLDPLNGHSVTKIESDLPSRLPFVAFSTRENKVVAIGLSQEFDETGFILDPTSGEIVKSFRADASIGTNPSQWSLTDGKFLAMVHTEFVSVRDIENDKDVFTIGHRIKYDPTREFNTLSLKKPFYCPSEGMLVYLRRGKKSSARVEFVETGSGEKKSIVIGRGSGVIDVDFSKKLIGATLNTGEIRILDFKGNLIGYAELPNRSGGKIHASFAPSGEAMLVGSSTSNLSVFALDKESNKWKLRRLNPGDN